MLDLYLNVAIGGVLTGLVYGLMALGLSVIFGVVRVVNFAHGEMMTMAMYVVISVFAALHLDPLVMLVPVAAAMFAFGYLVQASLINPFITRPEHSQFLLLVAIATIIVNVLLIIYGPDAQNVQVAYAFDSYQFGNVIVDATKLYASLAAIVVTAVRRSGRCRSLVGRPLAGQSRNAMSTFMSFLPLFRSYFPSLPCASEGCTHRLPLL